MAVLLCNVGDDDANGLDIGRLEVFEQATFISDRRWDPVVAYQWLGEDENLTTVRRIGQRLWVSN
jgi:hypothetical protein